MGQTPEELKREIEQTRRELSYDVDALNEKVSPSRIVSRKMDSTRSTVASVRERIMGTASTGTSSLSSAKTSIGDSANSTTSSLSSAASSVGSALTSSPDAAMQRAQGNPLAAGLIAFGAGWLISSVLPATKVEQQAAESLQDKASDLAEPVKEQAQQVAQELKDNLQEPAQQAVQQIKETATEAASTVKSEGQSAAQEVKSDAQSSAQAVKDAGSGS